MKTFTPELGWHEKEKQPMKKWLISLRGSSHTSIEEATTKRSALAQWGIRENVNYLNNPYVKCLVVRS